jgi:glutathione synthase/RimK-type ligase-like ATP-grasp enzyme
VIDKKIIGASLYKINGSLATSNVIDEKIVDFAKEMIEKFDFSGYVIDIATVNDEQKIMELNCLNAAGFYDINLYNFINAVTDYYEKTSKPKLKM